MYSIKSYMYVVKIELFINKYIFFHLRFLAEYKTTSRLIVIFEHF